MVEGEEASMLALFLYTIMEMSNLLFDGAVGTTPWTTGYSKCNLKFSVLPIIVLLIPSHIHMHMCSHARTQAHTRTGRHTHTDECDISIVCSSMAQKSNGMNHVHGAFPEWWKYRLFCTGYTKCLRVILWVILAKIDLPTYALTINHHPASSILMYIQGVVEK